MPTRFSFTTLAVLYATLLTGAEVIVIEPGSKPVISGKEVDWIYGDYLMKNDRISLVIAAPLPTRDANLTIRNIGASILDLTLNVPSNDQLSAFIPTSGRYLFQDPATLETGRDGGAVYWQCRSSATRAKDETSATVRYSLSDGDSYVRATVIVQGKSVGEIAAFDGVRADGWFVFEDSQNVAYCTDSFFRQTIGFQIPGQDKPPKWKRGRPYQLRYLDDHVERTEDKVQWTTHIYPATSAGDLLAAVNASLVPFAMNKFKVSSKDQPQKGVNSVNRAEVLLRPKDDQSVDRTEGFTIKTDDHGIAYARLAPGDYTAVVSAIGRESAEVPFNATLDGGTITLPMTEACGFEAVVNDGDENPIPVKATIYAIDGDDPNFGLSATRTFVQNCVYSVHGRFRCPLDPGKYEIYFSRGPEYNSARREIQVAANQMQTISLQLDRVLDTSGWVSADLHSHSSPSGDNTSDQYGRVENLLCEHIEFAPCTEHNRISSYVPHLKQMQLTHLMATCTGMELTGSLLPVNHQNAFPLHHHPHTQNGGGPRVSSNPVVQIERLAMWDDNSDKIVQMNHPNLHQIYGDGDTDGVEDAGFRKMLAWTDVIEVHPLETIFEDVASEPPNVRKMRIPLFQWMQLLNQGHRIPGVINTDSHYNHHGSGWRRIWINSSTDDPAEISADEMIRQLEAGHIVMSTGPFLSVSATSESNAKLAIPGDDLLAESGKVRLDVSVQCADWLDVNRVQVFINGRPSEEHNYTRKNAPDRFRPFASVTKFDSSIDLTLDNDAHVIVAVIGEGITLEKIMGRRDGKRPPIAVSNPIFVDVDNDGFDHNHDDLGLPLPGVGHEHPQG